MTERVQLVCRLAHTSTAYSSCQEYQLNKPKRHSSTLHKDRKLSIVSAKHPKSKIVVATDKPLTKAFIDDNLHTDDDVLRLRWTLLRKADIYHFDRVIGSSTHQEEANKKLFYSSVRRQASDLLNGKSSLILLAGCTGSGKYKAESVLWHQTVKTVLSHLRLNRGEDDYRLEVSLLLVYYHAVFDLARYKTVTGFRKANHQESSVIHIKHEEYFRSLAYLSYCNMKNEERKLQIGRDNFHQVCRLYVKRNGRLLSDLTFIKVAALQKCNKQDLNNLMNVVSGDDEYLEELDRDGLMQNVLNFRGSCPNFINIIFFLSSNPKMHYHSLLTLKTAYYFMRRMGRQTDDKYNRDDNGSVDGRRMHESNISCKKFYSGGSFKKHASSTSFKHSHETRSTEKGLSSRYKELIMRNEELYLKMRRLQSQLMSREPRHPDYEEEYHRLQIIDQDIQQRKKVKKYKDMIGKLEDMLKQQASNQSMVESRTYVNYLYRYQFYQVFYYNLMLREYNEILKERLTKHGNIDSQHTICQLEKKLAKAVSEKTILESKIKVMESYIGLMISYKQRDVDKLSASRKKQY